MLENFPTIRGRRTEWISLAGRLTVEVGVVEVGSWRGFAELAFAK